MGAGSGKVGDPIGRRVGPGLGPALGVAAGSTLVVLSALAPVSGFTVTHYLFTYQDGFLRRALVGSVLAYARGGPLPEDLPARIGVGYLALLIALVAAIMASAWRDGDRRVVALLATLFVGSSQLQILAFDVGKFDALLLAITAATALLATRADRWAVPAVAALGLVGVLVHELHLVAGVPLAAVMVALRPGVRRSAGLRDGLLVAAPAALVGLTLAALAGDPPGGSVAAAEARMAARAGFPIQESATFVQDLGLLDTIRMTIGVLLARPVPMLLSVLVAAPSALAALLLLRRSSTRNGSSTAPRARLGVAVALPIAALAPLVILLLGFDWYRWVTIAVINLTIAALWSQVVLRPGEGTDAGQPDGWRLHAAVGLVAVSLLLASVSLTDALANLRVLLSG